VFIDANREQFGVEPICRVLTEHACPIAPSTFYAAKQRPPSARAVRDVTMTAIMLTIFTKNYSVYGAHKLWKVMRRAGHEIGRDQVARLMRQAGIRGVRRGKQVITTRPDPAGTRAVDLVRRQFTAVAPNRLWVLDLTYVSTWEGMAYVCFIVDAFSRMIVGWRVAGNMRTDMVLDAMEMAAFKRGAHLGGLVVHSDAGSQFTSIRFTERVDEVGARPSIGTVADSYDNALAETVNGLYKTELTKRRGPWKQIETLELATAEYVQWFNTDRFHSGIGYLRPADLHDGIHTIIIERRQATLDTAARRHPERFMKPPRPDNAPAQAWINKPSIQTT
jgi:putative transposase